MTSIVLTDVEVKLLQDKIIIKNLEEWDKDISEIFQGRIRMDKMSYSEDDILSYRTCRLIPVLDMDESLRKKVKSSFGVAIKYKSYCFVSKKINSIGVVTIQDFENLNRHEFSTYIVGKYSIFLKTGEKGLLGEIGTRIYVE